MVYFSTLDEPPWTFTAQWRCGQIAVVGPPEGQAGDDGGPSAAAQPVQGLSIFRAEDLHHLLRMARRGGSAAGLLQNETTTSAPVLTTGFWG